MRLLVFAVVLVFGVSLGLAALSWANAYQGEFGTPATPQPISQNPAFAHYDVQIHSRGMDGTMEPVQAEHGPDCSGPPAVHTPGSRAAAVFACNDHLMTVLHEGGYGAIAITPTLQISGTSATVTWDMSTETQSNRDWVDVWVTPWAKNLTIPADIGVVDLQGVPRDAVQIRLAMDFNHAWCVNTYNNGALTTYLGCGSGTQPNIHTGIAFGTNEAAVRQSFKLTITPSSLRFERLASATALAMVYYDGPATVPNINGAVVQFEQHSYNPEKDGSCDAFIATGRPCGPTWHWANMVCTPCAPFTLIRPNITEIYKTGRDPTGATITFPPAPAGSFLRFTALGGVKVNGGGYINALAPKQANTNGAFLASPYFLPLQAGTTSVTLSFAPDGSYDLGFTMSIQDIAIWAQGGTPPSTPTPTATPTSQPLSPTPLPNPSPFPPSPTSTSTVTVVTSTPTATSTMVPAPTATTVPVSPTATRTSMPTATPLPPTATSTPVPPTSTPTPTGTPSPVCNSAYYLNGVLTKGAVIACP